jgi:hypothetical protein
MADETVGISADPECSLASPGLELGFTANRLGTRESTGIFLSSVFSGKGSFIGEGIYFLFLVGEEDHGLEKGRWIWRWAGLGT